MPDKMGWEEEFDNDYRGWAAYDKHRDFIKRLLAEQKKEFVEDLKNIRGRKLARIGSVIFDINGLIRKWEEK